MARRRAKKSDDRRRGRAFWAEVVSEQETTGESTREVCVRLDLNPNTLNWWRWRLRQELEAAESSPTAQFLPVRVVGGPLAVEASLDVVLASGRTIRVPPGFSPEHLAQIVATLEAVP